ncbi:hypothetical protein LXL04_010984 [Taraxacum kok-saghyz]
MINRLLNHIHRFLAQDLIEFKEDITNLFVRAINSIKHLPVLMEDKRLNINQPLLSVRRHSPKASSQKNESRKFGSYLPTMPPIEPLKTEFKLSPLKNTGNIPFVWEHSPGRPKDHETNNQIPSMESPLGIPKLPPGRISKPKKKDPDHITTTTTEDHNHIHSSLQSVFQTESKFQRSKSVKKERTPDTISSDEQDDSNETFMDALDTLSRGDQSSFYNCSTSGVNVNFTTTHDQSDMNRSDPKLRDFMMGRFLPAAKAMASEPPPQHSSRKHFFTNNNNLKDVKKLANMENKKLQLRYGPTFLQDKEQQQQDEEEEDDDDSDHHYYEHENTSFKFCGLIPRFCSKGSLNLVGPVPGLSIGTRTRTRTHLSSNSLGSFIEIENSLFTKYHASTSTSTSKQNNLEGSKLYNRLQGCGISSGFVKSIQSPVSENQKKRLSFKELLNDRNRNEDSIIEKTLYVDTENSIPSNLKKEGSGSSQNTEIEDENSKDSEEDSGYDVPAPPPLPKSPSDSWLGRTLLPSVSNKQIRWNPRFRSSDSRTESDKTTPLRIPKGPLLPIPEN